MTDWCGRVRSSIRAAASGQQIYGLNTGLGANLKTSVTEDISAFQQQLVRGRGMGVGPSLPRDETRAVMAARLSMLAVGGSGISPSVFNDLLALLNKHVHPVLPSIGSIGAGDLVLLSAIARSLIGEGNAEYQGQVYPSGQALEMSGLAPSALGPKDGLSLLNASAVSVGCGALVAMDTASLLDFQRQAAALSFEALGGNPLILTPAIQRAPPLRVRPKRRKNFWHLLEGSSLFGSQAAIQDPLSLRCVAPIQGALAQAVNAATEAVEIELNAAADNPLVIVDEGRVLSTGNFHTPSLGAGFRDLGPRYRAGSAGKCRTVHSADGIRTQRPAALSYASWRRLGRICAAAEDGSGARWCHTPQGKSGAAGLPAGLGRGRRSCDADAARRGEVRRDYWFVAPLIACEMLAAAQAIDLRPELRCGRGTRQSYDLVRAVSPKLEADRALGADVLALVDGLRQ